MTEIKTYSSNGLEMDWFSFGNGKRAFVMIPGLSLKSVMRSARTIENAYDVFKDEYTVYVIDKRKNPPKDYSVKAMACDTVQLIRNLELCDIYLFGTSLGGMISQQIAVDNPSLVKKLIVASSLSRANDTARETIERWLSLAQSRQVTLLNRDFVNTIYSDAFLEKYRAVFKMFENDGTEEECELFCTYAGACIGFDIYASLNKINCPVLVIGAWGDKALSGMASVEIAEKLGCECFMYTKDYGHAVYDETEDYKERIMSFFND